MRTKKQYQGIYQEKFVAPWEFSAFADGHYHIKKDIRATYRRNRSISITY